MPGHSGVAFNRGFFGIVGRSEPGGFFGLDFGKVRFTVSSVILCFFCDPLLFGFSFAPPKSCAFAVAKHGRVYSFGARNSACFFERSGPAICADYLTRAHAAFSALKTSSNLSPNIASTSAKSSRRFTPGRTSEQSTSIAKSMNLRISSPSILSKAVDETFI